MLLCVCFSVGGGHVRAKGHAECCGDEYNIDVCHLFWRGNQLLLRVLLLLQAERAVRGWEASRGEHRRYRDTTVKFTWKTVLLYIMLGMEIFLVSFFLCSLYFLEAVHCDAVCFHVSADCKLPSGDR